MAELELKEVSYFYESGGKRIDILDKASYSFEKGTLYTIVGPSGSGKTTTLTLAGALEEPKSGCVCFEGKDIREIGYTRYRNSKIGIVFQAYNLLPYLTPLENVLAAMEITSNPIKNKKERARELLTRTDEPLQSPGRGDPDGGAYQQLTAISINFQEANSSA